MVTPTVLSLSDNRAAGGACKGADGRLAKDGGGGGGGGGGGSDCLMVERAGWSVCRCLLIGGDLDLDEPIPSLTIAGTVRRECTTHLGNLDIYSKPTQGFTIS